LYLDERHRLARFLATDLKLFNTKNGKEFRHILYLNTFILIQFNYTSCVSDLNPVTVQRFN